MQLTMPITNASFGAPSRRRAMSLIETVAVMAASAAIVAAAVSTLLAFVQADRQLSTRADRHLQLTPMLEQVRTDLRNAKSAKWRDQTLKLRTLAGEEISYRSRSGTWERLCSQDDDSAEFTGAYHLPDGAQLSMSPANAAAGELVRVEWSTHAADSLPNRPTPPADELVVTVGRDVRLLHP